MIDYRATPACPETLAALAWAVNQGDTDWLEAAFDAAGQEPLTRDDHMMLDQLRIALDAAAEAERAQRCVLAGQA